jgi:hypothetical protein
MAMLDVWIASTCLDVVNWAFRTFAPAGESYDNRDRL